jgi:hypothetical protein
MLTFMPSCACAKRLPPPAAALAALLLPVSALATSSSGHLNAHAAGSVLQSRQLWATINICNPKDQPDILGVRGSMPSDGRPRDTMYMSFRLQYVNSSTKRWTDLAETKSSFVYVGSGAARQGGQSFQLMPVPARPAVTLRGLVEFQWRRGKIVLQSTRRPTTAPHTSLAGADPRGFSAASCQIG